MHKPTDPLEIKILMFYEGLAENNATSRAVRELKKDLEAKEAKVIVSESPTDARAVIASDPEIQCVLLNYDENDEQCPSKLCRILQDIRARNANLPVFLLSDRYKASAIPSDILDKVSDFIWILEDTSDFISGRILAATERYREFVLPPMFKALADFAKVHEYSWHTPGHTGGTGFLKSPAGRAFFNFFGEPIFRSDLSISVGELGSLLDHSGPIGESEKYAARFSAPTGHTMSPTALPLQTALCCSPALPATKWLYATVTAISLLSTQLPCPALFRPILCQPATNTALSDRFCRQK